MQGDMQGFLTRPIEPKKRAVKLGDLTALFNLPTEGGVFHRKVSRRERAF
jgi:hypothetical protein